MALPIPPPSERTNEGRKIKSGKTLIDSCGEGARGLHPHEGIGTACKEHAPCPLVTPYKTRGEKAFEGIVPFLQRLGCYTRWVRSRAPLGGNKSLSLTVNP